MQDTNPDAISCSDLQQAFRQARALTAAEAAHLESCETCLEAWLDATVAQALGAKPEVGIPADFAACVATQLPAKRGALTLPRQRMRPWGLFTAILLVSVGLVAAAIADPSGLNTRMGIVFMGLVASEIAGIALWLGRDWQP